MQNWDDERKGRESSGSEVTTWMIVLALTLVKLLSYFLR